MKLKAASVVIVLAVLGCGLAAPLHGADAPDVATRRAQFNQLLGQEWEYELQENPDEATTIGDYRYNDRWHDVSLAHVEVTRQAAQQWIARFEAVDATGFSEQEQLSREVMLDILKKRVEGIDLKTYEMPVDQFIGLQLFFPQMVPQIPFDTARHYEDYLARLHAIPKVFDDLRAVLEQGAKDKLMPPRFLLQKVVEQCLSIAKPAGEANVFGQPVAHFPDAISAADQKRLHDGIVAAVDGEVRPAYSKLADFLAKDYVPKGRAEPGVWALPNGDALYRYDIRLLATSDLEPAAIHEIGLHEVARIEGEELAIAKKLGFTDLKVFRESLKTNPKLIPQSREQILQVFGGYISQLQPELPKLFGLLPKTRVEVKPVQEYREAEAAMAEYFQGTPDGSRPGIVYVNTSDYAHRSLLEMESTAYHEGIPGHHLQISIAQTLPIPAFRQQVFYSAYEEGWALYAERLGKDIGFYQDAYQDYGRLSGEMLRAIRLVLDTGVHAKHWTRQQMVDFFHAHSDESEPEVQAETDRYIAWPAQALGYKLGQLEILNLREQARAELGDRFDIRAFHDEILNGGALPLAILDRRVTAWVAAQKQR